MRLFHKLWDKLVDWLVWDSFKKWCRTPHLFDTKPTK